MSIVDFILSLFGRSAKDIGLDSLSEGVGGALNKLKETGLGQVADELLGGEVAQNVEALSQEGLSGVADNLIGADVSNAAESLSQDGLGGLAENIAQDAISGTLSDVIKP